jgi:hypothetical protein
MDIPYPRVVRGSSIEEVSTDSMFWVAQIHIDGMVDGT